MYNLTTLPRTDGFTIVVPFDSQLPGVVAKDLFLILDSLVLPHITKELDVDRDVVASELPRVEVKPIVRNLDLITINNLLLEDTVFVSQSVTPGGIVERGQAVEEASGKTAKTAISKRSVVLLTDNVFHAEAEIRYALCILTRLAF